MSPKNTKSLSNIQKIACPYCGPGTSIILIVDFSKKWASNENIAFCVKTITKNLQGVPSVKGCNKSFKLIVLERTNKLFKQL